MLCMKYFQYFIYIHTVCFFLKGKLNNLVTFFFEELIILNYGLNINCIEFTKNELNKLIQFL